MKKLIFTLIMIIAQPVFAELQITGAKVQISSGEEATAGAFMTITNTGEKSVVLTDVSSDISYMTHFHDVVVNDGLVSMVSLEQITIPARGSVEFKMGGLHIMFMGMKGDLKEGDSVELVFELNNGRILSTVAHVVDRN